MLDKLKVLMFLGCFVHDVPVVMATNGLILENINNLSVLFNQVNHTSFGSHIALIRSNSD